MKKAIIITVAALAAVGTAVAGYCVYRSNQYFGKRVFH